MDVELERTFVPSFSRNSVWDGKIFGVSSIVRFMYLGVPFCG